MKAKSDNSAHRAAMRFISDYNYQIRKKFGITEFFVLENAQRKIVYSGKSYEAMTRMMERGNGSSYTQEDYRSYYACVRKDANEIQITDWKVIRYEDSASIKEKGKNVISLPSSIGLETLEKILQGYNPQIKLAKRDSTIRDVLKGGEM